MFDEKEIKQTLQKVKKANARKVLIQIPEGLKTRALDIASLFEKSGVAALINCDPCYGGCDIIDHQAKQLGCDLLVHFGHTEYKITRKTQVPVLYEEYRMEFSPIPLLEMHMKLLRPCNKICLVTTAQYLDALEIAKRHLEKKGKKVYVGQPDIAKYPGQVLGCDYSAAIPFDKMVDAFLYLGTGRFHPIGLAIRVEKPVLVLDFELNTLENMHRERDMLLRIRFAQIEKAKEMQNFGILVSTKTGQANIGTAEKVKQKLKKKGRRAWILTMNEIAPSKLLGMKLDCLVNCACPRVTEDFRQFRKPILNPEDIDKL